MRIRATILISIVAASLFAYAQDEAGTDEARQQFPCEDREEFRQFDFWLGEWDVRLANGTLAGRNTIEKAQKGCVVVENWVSTTGVPGMSMNFFDISKEEWVQIWSGAGGTQIDIRGGLTDEGMLLEGRIHYVGNGTSAPFRGLWALLEDGRVRQFFEQSNDGGETWAPWFEGFYTKTSGAEQMSQSN